MFDKKGFIAFVGETSGGNYANGLDNIEKTYHVDIDAELVRDRCSYILSLIDADKKTMSGNERHNRQNWYSHLKKYLDYIGPPFEIQKKRFASWFKQQPQRHHSDKLYADATVTAAVRILESQLSTLGVPGYETVNCFEIADIEEFKALHLACYGAATEMDKKNGYGDFRNALDFYLQFLTETANNGGNSEMRKKIRLVIAHYKANFANVNAQERYKWEAIRWYQQHWNIDSPDFAKMLTTSFSKAYNLLTSSMYYPFKMISVFAVADPAAVKKIFNILYNEQLPLEERCQIFKQSCDARIEQLKQAAPDPSKPLNHYQDLRAMMVYLTFQYPEKYYLFKSTMYATFRDRVGFLEPQTAKKTSLQKCENYSRLCNTVLAEVRKDDELLSMHKSRLDSTCYQDEALHLLTMDIVYYGSNYMSAEHFSTGDSYWPSLKDYNPGITKEMWLEILQDKTITTDDTMRLLNMFMELGGESSFNNLVAQFGNQFYYKGTLQDFSARVIDKVNCSKCPKEYSEFSKYIIPFVGRMVMEGDIKRDSWKLRDELKSALSEFGADAPQLKEVKNMKATTDIGLNTILYGPPGTGKTYHTVIYAVAIIENKPLDAVKAENYQDVLNRYNSYKEHGKIEFTTFHQSYGYEEFIEGIRPVVADEDEEADAGTIRYRVQSGIFKKFCERASVPTSVRASLGDFGISENANIWKVSLGGAGENPIRTDCLKNEHIRIGWEKQDGDASGSRVFNAFSNRMQIGDIVFSCYNTSVIDAIGVVTDEYELSNEYSDYRSLRKVNWLAKNIREDIRVINGGKNMMQPSVYALPRVSISDAYKLIEKYQAAEHSLAERKDNYVFIIDEINRGNISKIFGELITLIEESKRIGKAEGMHTLLPYSAKPFGVPENVYIIGTMNTADRSIAAIDTALRRRFEFKEMLPNTDVLSNISIGSLSIRELLDRMNRRISALYDREHTIGHAYFIPLSKDNSIEKLADIFKNKVIPLLQEYFYEDYEKIRLVLGDNRKKESRDQFILAEKINQTELFGSPDVGLDDGYSYEINEDAFMNLQAYLQI